MITTSTQYLQVPKILPHRKARSRSKSRAQDVISVAELCVFPNKSCDTQRLRFTSPPAPVHRRPQSPSSPIKTTMATVMTTRAPSPVNGLHHPKNNPRRMIPPPADSLPRDVRSGTTSNKLVVRKVSTHTALVQPHNPNDLNGDVYTLKDCATPPPPDETPLRNKIIGAWKLESYVAYPTEESIIKRPTYPMTKNVTGFIMYTPDGYMSAQMLIPGQQSFKRGEGEEPQWAEAGKRCFAYCGPYYISNEGTGREEILRHTFQVCNLPGWIGDIQVRTHRFEEDGQVLVLGSEEPSEIKGDKRRPVLKWRRARDNTNGVPPPPTPAIKISGPGEP